MSFENIHRNKTWAFIDGALVGLAITYFINLELSAKRDRETVLKRREIRMEGFEAGWNERERIVKEDEVRRKMSEQN